jgi:CRP-like cAMP-binding protein
MANIAARFGSWLACCLGRGERAPIGDADVADLVSELGEQRHAGGTFVFREGDASARVHIVRDGAIELSRANAGRRVTIQTLQPGDVFGDVPLFLGEPEPFDARAVVDSTVLSMDAETLFRLMATRPRLARRWMVSLAGRMAGLQQRLIQLLAGGLEAQLAALLLERSDEAGRVSMSQSQLASLLGVQRTSVQRVLKQLGDAGLLEVGYRKIELTDRAGLMSLVEGDQEV